MEQSGAASGEPHMLTALFCRSRDGWVFVRRLTWVHRDELCRDSRSTGGGGGVMGGAHLPRSSSAFVEVPHSDGADGPVWAP